MSPITKCMRCGITAPETRRSDSHYCSEKCRTAAKRLRNKQNKKKRKVAKQLSGLPVSEPLTDKPPVPNVKIPEKPVTVMKVVVPEKESTPPQLTYDQMPPLRSYLADINGVNLSDIPIPPIPPPEFEMEAPVPIEQQVKHYTVTIKNPQYQTAKTIADKSGQQLADQRQLIKNLQSELEQTKTSVNTPVGEYLLYAGCGSVVGYYNAKNRKRKRAVQKQQEETDWSAFWGAVAGFGLVKVKDLLTKDSFEKEKQKKIIALTNRLKYETEKLKNLHPEFQKHQHELTKHDELTTLPRMDFLNKQEYEKRQLEITDYNKQKAEYETALENYQILADGYQHRYGSLDKIPEIERQVAKPLVDVDGVVSSEGLNSVVGGALLLKGYWREFLGLPSRDFKLIIHGVSGGGKSHLMLQFAHYLAVHHGTVLYNTSEEGFSVTLAAKLKKLSAETPGLDIGKLKTAAEVKEKIPRNVYNFIVLDSVNDMNMDADELNDLRQHYCCSAIIGICQNTKGGDIRGGYDLVHDADIKLRVEEQGAVFTDKNRFLENKPEFSAFNLAPIPSSVKAQMPEGFSEKQQQKKEKENNNKQKAEIRLTPLSFEKEVISEKPPVDNPEKTDENLNGAVNDRNNIFKTDKTPDKKNKDDDDDLFYDFTDRYNRLI